MALRLAASGVWELLFPEVFILQHGASWSPVCFLTGFFFFNIISQLLVSQAEITASKNSLAAGDAAWFDPTITEMGVSLLSCSSAGFPPSQPTPHAAAPSLSFGSVSLEAALASWV